MKNVFNVGLCKQGTHGGKLHMEEGGAVFRAAKPTAPADCKTLELAYTDMLRIHPAKAMVVLPAIKLVMQDGTSHTFRTLRQKAIVRALQSRSNAAWEGGE